MTNQNPSFDAARYKQTQHDQCNEDGAGWHRWRPTYESWGRPTADVMVDLARIEVGLRILDIGSGTGEPGLSASALVGPQGYILATDLSEKSIQFAQQIADERHLHNFETRAMDGENLDLPDESFDVVLCRYALFYMPDKRRALSEWRRVLKPGGRVVVAVFSTPERNGWGSVPISIIRRRAQVPPPLPGSPGPFSLGMPGVLEAELDQAGFRDVQTRILSAPLRLKSAEEFRLFALESFGAFNQMMIHLSRAERESIWDEVAQSMRQFEGSHGFEAPCEPIVGVGVK